MNFYLSKKLIFNAVSIKLLKSLRISRFSSFINPVTSCNDHSSLESTVTPVSWDEVGWATDLETESAVTSGVKVFKNFISEDEESCIMEEVEPHLKRLRYENSHWDDAIHGYREIERKSWSSKNRPIIERAQKISFNQGDKLLQHVHVLDLLATGVIKAHVDSVKFCGSTISGLCLLTSCVMRFADVEDKTRYADVLLPRFCLYVMKDVARYKFTHEVLPSELSFFKDQPVVRSRRVVVLCRSQPTDDCDGGEGKYGGY